MTFSQDYQNFLQVFNPHLESYLDSIPAQVKDMDKSVLSLIETASLATKSSGKRLRPYLVSLGYQIAGKQSYDQKTVFDAALVAEIFHSFAVIHDDIIDKSDSRRNQKTSHVVFEDIHMQKQLKNDASHFGVSMAILAGDLEVALSSFLISNLNINLDIKQKLLSSYSEMFFNLVLGQYQDVYQSFDPKRPSEKMIMSTLRWKSGEYTIEFPLKFGGLLGGADEKLLDFFKVFAVPVGIAFQLKDDLLGVFSSSADIGKSNLSDIREGKNTLLIKYALDQANSDQKSQLDRILGNENSDENDLNTVQKILVDTGSKACIENKILQLSKEAKSCVSTSGIEEKYKNIIEEFADFVINRDK